MQILKNIYQVGGDLNGITFDGVDAGYNDCNTYIIATDNGLIMIDSGCGDTLDQIFRNMKYWSLNPEDIKYCILTHPHLDHAGGGAALKKQGVKIIAISETADAVSKGDERTCPYLYHKKFNPFEVDIIIKDNESFEILGINFEVMHLPGHSMGCTAYLFNHEEKRIVISGDVIGTLLAGFHGWDGSIDFNKEKYIESLIRFSKIDSDVMLPGHGMIYFYKPRRRVEEALNLALIEWR
ncbi:MAG: MBL fold metallo-hydrolase [Ignavibacteriales bacterium]|nr:MBL fold metallo-hydrolase [Ignavibacteriales bacterium]MCB9260661.1 MBL fold metallo-hydrolase [Ignavibacteriales bacterium]